MIILGIESSCDETAAAVVANGRRVLSSAIASQIKAHAVFGGVVPEIAAREHLQAINPLVTSALSDAGMTLKEIDAIAVTQGPGLIGSLLIGTTYSKGLALASGKPLIPVDHVHAHVHGALLGVDAEPDEIFPCLALVVSGGHSNLYFMETPTSFDLLGFSIDDACGESFDKVAKLLGLPYPGGPAVERLAQQGDATRFPMPKMMSERQRLRFSYSGLKTHVVNLVQGLAHLGDQDIADVCASFQEEALGQIVRKLSAAQQMRRSARSILVSGGVAANQRFKAMVSAELEIPVYFPALSYCSDNAAMIAAYAFHLVSSGAVDGHLMGKDQHWDPYSRYNFSGHSAH